MLCFIVAALFIARFGLEILFEYLEREQMIGGRRKLKRLKMLGDSRRC